MELTVIYYTANYLDMQNPYFLNNTKRQLSKAIGNLPLIAVSHKPIEPFTAGDYKNIVIGDIGRSHLNIYRQILQGAKEAKTEYVAMAEDDVLYSAEHFNPVKYIRNLRDNVFYYDMNKVSLFTWTKPPMFSFRTKRRVVNSLIAPRKMLIESLEERFKRLEVLRKTMSDEEIIKYWCDPGRNERTLGVTPRETEEFYTDCPSIVFTHPKAFGYLNHGKRKRMGDLRIIELYQWGRAEDVLKLWGEVEKQ